MMQVQPLHCLPADRKILGGKAYHLRLLNKNICIPPSFVLSTNLVESILNSFVESELLISTFNNFSLANQATTAWDHVVALIRAGAPIPSVLGQMESLMSLHPGPWILRSSSTLEDNTDASWAGQFDSEIVEKSSEVWPALTKVIASRFRTHTVKQALARNKNLGDLRMAVLFQPLVKCDVAGVAFSRDPRGIKQEHDDSWGLVEYSYANINAVTSGQGKLLQTSFNAEHAPLWLSTLADTVIQLRKQFRRELDIEFAVKNENLIVLQLRPIIQTEVKKQSILSRTLAAERFPEPLSPLGWTCMQPALSESTKALKQYLGINLPSAELLAQCKQGIVYANEDLLGLRSLRFLSLSFWVKAFVASTWHGCKSLFWQPSLQLLAKLWLIVQWNIWLRLSLPVLNDAKVAHQHFTREFTGQTEFQDDGSAISVLIESGKTLLKTDLAVHVCKTFGLKLLKKSIKTKDWSIYLDYLSQGSLVRQRLFDTSAANWRLSWDIAQPNLAESPELAALYNHAKAIAKRNSSIKISVNSPSWLPLDTLRDLMDVDDAQHHSAMLLISKSRDVIRPLARELVTKGILTSVEQIFFLELDELLAAVYSAKKHWGFIAERRIQEHARTQVNSDLRPPIQSLQVIGASPGIGSGKLVIINSLDDLEKIEPQSILYCDSPRPELAAFFPYLAGLVAKSNSCLSHAMIAARECGLPAICGVDLAALNLQVGDVITIDGTLGTIHG